MENNNYTSSPLGNVDELHKIPLTHSDLTSQEPSGSFNGGTPKSNWTGLAEIIGIVVAVIAVIGFIVGIMITQANISNDIKNVSKNIDDYKNDNVVIKTQIESWFSRMDIKLDYIKDNLKK